MPSLLCPTGGLGRKRRWRGGTLWALTQAVAWERSDVSLLPAALLVDELLTSVGRPTPLAAELRQWLSAHGVDPRAAASLLCHVECGPMSGESAPTPLAAGRRRRLERQLAIGPDVLSA
jgi:hypothetical protein